jgi:hypothetical protein
MESALLESWNGEVQNALRAERVTNGFPTFCVAGSGYEGFDPAVFSGEVIS